MSSNKETSTGYYPDRRPIALFLDLDNLLYHIKSEDAVGILLNALSPWGNVVVRKAFGNSHTFKNNLYRQLLRHKFELADSSYLPHKKNGTDIRIAMEIMEVLHTRSGVRTFAIASGDGDFIALVHRLQQHRCAVIGIGSQRTSARKLTESCDVFLFYEDLVATSRQSKPDQSKDYGEVVLTGEEALKRLLRRKNLYPCPPDILAGILTLLQKLGKILPCSLKTLQNQLAEDSHRHGYSKNMARHTIKTLTSLGFLISDSEDVPFTQKTVRCLPEIFQIENVLAKAQIESLLQEDNLVTDHLTIASVIWNDPHRASEIENLIAKQPNTAESVC